MSYVVWNFLPSTVEARSLPEEKESFCSLLSPIMLSQAKICTEKRKITPRRE